MNTLVNQSGKPKPIGVRSELFKSRFDPAAVGELVEVTDPHGQVINLAQVTDITGDTVHILIVA